MKKLSLLPLLFSLFSQAQVFELRQVNIDSLVAAKIAALVPKRDTVMYFRKDTVVMKPGAAVNLNTDSLLKGFGDSAAAVLKKLSDAQVMLSGLSTGAVPQWVELKPADATGKVYNLPNAAIKDFAIVFVGGVAQNMVGKDGKAKDYTVKDGIITFTASRTGKLVQAFYFMNS